MIPPWESLKLGFKFIASVGSIGTTIVFGSQAKTQAENKTPHHENELS